MVWWGAIHHIACPFQPLGVEGSYLDAMYGPWARAGGVERAIRNSPHDEDRAMARGRSRLLSVERSTAPFRGGALCTLPLR